MDRNKCKRLGRLRRHFRIRKKAMGTAERPRLVVFRSLRHIYAQLIDDDRQRTLAASSTLDKGVRGDVKGTGNKKAAEAVGMDLARKALALEAPVKKVCFDRGGYKYHGRVKALADAARKAGLEF